MTLEERTRGWLRRPALGRRAATATAIGSIVLAACGGGSGGDDGSTSAEPAADSTTSSSATDVPPAAGAVDPRALPLGDGSVSSSAQVGKVNSCQTTFGGGGAFADGPWIEGDTWDLEAKIHVQGDVRWPQAKFTEALEGARRVITTMGVPVEHGTGTFPVAASDPAYAYDRNPNTIAAAPATVALPANPVVAATPTCLGLGSIGILRDGVFLFNALDAQGRDAAAHEVLDACDGHPERTGTYHHHTVPSCVLDDGTEASTLVGYAADGFGIYVERSASGSLLTNGDLDECHGRTSSIEWNGQQVSMYHYVATLEYPYTLGCYRGTPVRLGS